MAGEGLFDPQLVINDWYPLDINGWFDSTFVSVPSTGAVYKSSVVTRVADLSLGATLTAPTGVVAGNLLLCALSIDETADTAITFTGWTLLSNQSIATPDGQFLKIYGRIATGTDSYAISGGQSPAQTTAIVACFSGNSNTLPSNIVATTNTTSNTTPVLLSLTGLTASAGSCVAVFTALDQTVQTDTWGFSPITNYNEREDDAGANWNTIGLQTRNNVSAGSTGTLSTTATRATGTGNAGWIGIVVEIVNGSANTSLSPTIGHLTFTGYQPSVSQSITTNLTPTVGHLVFGQKTPSISQTTTLALSPNVGHLVFGQKTPSVTQSSSLSAGVGHLVFTGYSPNVTQSVSLTPTIGHLTFTGYQPTINQTITVSLSPSVGHLVLNGKQPSISQPHVASPNVAHLVFNGYAPSVTQSLTTSLSPTKGHLSFTGYAASIAQTNNIALFPNIGHLTINGKLPSISQSGSPVFPLPSQVLAGVTYGPNGNDFTGTLTGGGGAYLRRR